MTATPSHTSATPSVERRADPSMEDVLASIRKIISDEDAAHTRLPPDPVVPAARPVPVPANSLSSASILTPPATVGRSWGASPPAIPRPAPPQFGLSRPAVALPVPPVAPAPEPMPEQPTLAVAARTKQDPTPTPLSVPAAAPFPSPDMGALLSAATTDSITSAFQTLTTSVALTNAETIDRHVRDLLRPMLRTWLDDNLPGIVEKLVRLEIERVARGGR